MTARTGVVMIGSGKIDTDLMSEVVHKSKTLAMGAFFGIDTESDGLRRASGLGVPITAKGIDDLVAMHEFANIGIVFDEPSVAWLAAKNT